ncbi:MAG TPA: hypothetical protein VLC09_16895 [Polyangiaceae bacterium]|nr:hypothetical protein [Polyangiaceae bacterium]
MAVLTIEPTKESELSTDEGLLRTVWGYVYSDDRAHAVYFVRWNDTSLDEAVFVVSVGAWGDGSTSQDRQCTAALGRVHQGQLAFRWIDAGETSFADNDFLGVMRRADDLRESPLADEVSHVLDHLLTDDPRIRDLRERLMARADVGDGVEGRAGVRH